MNILRESIEFLSEPDDVEDINASGVVAPFTLTCCTRPIFYAGAPVLYSNVSLAMNEFKILQRSPFFHLTQQLKLNGAEFNDDNFPTLLKDHLPYVRQLCLDRTLVSDITVEHVIVQRMPQLTLFSAFESLGITASSVVKLLDHPSGPRVALGLFFYDFTDDEAACRALVLEHDVLTKMFALLDKRNHGHDTLRIWRGSFRLILTCVHHMKVFELSLAAFTGILERCELLLEVEQVQDVCVKCLTMCALRMEYDVDDAPLEVWEPYFDAILRVLPTFLDMIVGSLRRRCVELTGGIFALFDVVQTWWFRCTSHRTTVTSHRTTVTRLRDRLEEQCVRAGLLDAVQAFMLSSTPAELRFDKHWEWLLNRCDLELPIPDVLLALSVFHCDLALQYLTTPITLLFDVADFDVDDNTSERPNDWIPLLSKINKVMSMDGGREMFVQVLESVTAPEINPESLKRCDNACRAIDVLRFVKRVTTDVPGQGADVEQMCIEAKEHLRVITADERFVKKRDEFAKWKGHPLQEIAKELVD